MLNMPLKRDHEIAVNSYSNENMLHNSKIKCANVLIMQEKMFEVGSVVLNESLQKLIRRTFCYLSKKIFSFTASICSSLQAKNTATITKAYSANTGLYEISSVCDEDRQSFLLTPKQLPVMQARCDMETDEGGWMVILH